MTHLLVLIKGMVVVNPALDKQTFLVRESCVKVKWPTEVNVRTIDQAFPLLLASSFIGSFALEF